MSEGRISVNKVTVTKPISIEGDLYIEIQVPHGWDDVKKLVNKVDRNIACFKHKHKTVGIIRN